MYWDCGSGGCESCTRRPSLRLTRRLSQLLHIAPRLMSRALSETTGTFFVGTFGESYSLIGMHLRSHVWHCGSGGYESCTRQPPLRLTGRLSWEKHVYNAVKQKHKNLCINPWECVRFFLSWEILMWDPYSDIGKILQHTLSTSSFGCFIMVRRCECILCYLAIEALCTGKCTFMRGRFLVLMLIESHYYKRQLWYIVTIELHYF